MRSRRQFVCLSLTSLFAAMAEYALSRTQIDPEGGQSPRATPAAPSRQAWLPLVQRGPGSTALAAADPLSQIYLPYIHGTPFSGDMPIVGAPSGTAAQAIDWLAPRADGYTPDDVATIVEAYARVGSAAGIDWFLALAQMAYETGHLTSWWAQRPRRNPAGIGVTGQTLPGEPDQPPGAEWTWDGEQWREGWSFLSWAGHSVPAHLGRLLAYALTDAQANTTQQQLIASALAYRPLPSSYRGAAPTIARLNGRWAVPGTNYGQTIVALMRRMRDGV
jgi:hypothetical protein